MELAHSLVAFLKTPLAQNVVLLAAAIIAVVSILSARATERRRQTVDILFRARRDEEMTKSLREIAQLHDNPDTDLKRYASDQFKTEDAANSLRYVLNHWEYISVGIQKNIYDEKMIKKASYNTAVGLFDRTEAYIKKLRENERKDTIYQEFEWLAQRWTVRKLKKKRKSFSL